MKRPLLIATSLLAVLFVLSSNTLLAEQPAKMTIIAVDRFGNVIEGARVSVVVGGLTQTLTTDIEGRCLLETPGTLIKSIEVTKDNCTERLAPVRILDRMTTIVTLHCWPAG